MPEHLKLLPVLLVMAAPILVVARLVASPLAMSGEEYLRLRNTWLAITFAAFLAHNFWVFVFLATCILVFVVRKEPSRLALFFFVLFAVPPIKLDIPGFGIVNHFFTMHYLRLLALTILLPEFLRLRKEPDTLPFGRTLADKCLAGFMAVNCVLFFDANTFTNTLRVGVFYQFVDVFLPYYVASRSLKSIESFRKALMAFVIAALVLGAVGVFEMLKGWLVYSSLEPALGVRWGLGNYLHRDELLRALASTGHPIALGYVSMVAIAMHLYLHRVMAERMWTLWVLGLLVTYANAVRPAEPGDVYRDSVR